MKSFAPDLHHLKYIDKLGNRKLRNQWPDAPAERSDRDERKSQCVGRLLRLGRWVR
jgi:hypothetical protein